MLGPPIGFLIEFGHTGVSVADTPNQMLKFQVIYNECPCPASKFLATYPPPDLSTTAVVNPAISQVLPF